MTGLFRVHYFDAKRGYSNMEAFSVLASNAEEAIKKADGLKTMAYYRVEAVELIGWSDYAMRDAPKVTP